MIYLIRHGETEANIKHIYCGSTDLPLSNTGVRKLEVRRDDEVIRYLREKADCVFVTSGMMRTEQTLEILFEDMLHIQDTRFREIDFGKFEMKSYYDLKNTAEYQRWLFGDNEENVCPGGESGRQMEERVMEAFNELCAIYLSSEQQQDAVVITHGGVIAAIMNNLFPEAGFNRFEWQPAPGCGYVIKNEIEYTQL